MTERVLALHGKKSHDVPIIRRAILRFALCSGARCSAPADVRRSFSLADGRFQLSGISGGPAGLECGARVLDQVIFFINVDTCHCRRAANRPANSRANSAPMLCPNSANGRESDCIASAIDSAAGTKLRSGSSSSRASRPGSCTAAISMVDGVCAAQEANALAPAPAWGKQ